MAKEQGVHISMVTESGTESYKCLTEIKTMLFELLECDLSFSVHFFRSGVGIHCFSSCCGSDAGPPALGHFLLHYDHLLRIRQ